MLVDRATAPFVVAATTATAKIVVFSLLNMLMPHASKEAIHHPRTKAPPPPAKLRFLGANCDFLDTMHDRMTAARSYTRFDMQRNPRLPVHAPRKSDSTFTAGSFRTCGE